MAAQKIELSFEDAGGPEAFRAVERCCNRLVKRDDVHPEMIATAFEWFAGRIRESWQTFCEEGSC